MIRFVSVVLSIACGAAGFAVESVSALHPTSPHPTGEDFRQALAASPMVEAARARLGSTQRESAVAGVLPDPRAGLDVGREAARNGTVTPMYGAMIEQPLPSWGSRDAQRLSATAQTHRSEAELAEITGEQAALVSAALAEAEAKRGTVVLLTEAQQRVHVLKESLRLQIASGGVSIGAALALDTRANELALQISDAERLIADAESEARGRLGIPPSEPLPVAAFPTLAEIDLAATPLALRAAAARASANAEEREAQARGNPETSVGLGWEREMAGTDDQNDKFRLFLTVSLPVHRAAYEAAADAARSRARAAAHEVVGSRWMARSLVARATRAADQAARARRAAESLVDRTRIEMDAVTQQVATAGSSFVQVMDLLERITAAQQQVLESELTSNLALADLWRLAPPILPVNASRPAEHQVEESH